MAYLAPGNRSVTACAITCAVEWRSTSRPSSESGVTIATRGVVVDRAVEVDHSLSRRPCAASAALASPRPIDAAMSPAVMPWSCSRVRTVGQRDRDRHGMASKVPSLRRRPASPPIVAAHDRPVEVDAEQRSRARAAPRARWRRRRRRAPRSRGRRAPRAPWARRGRRRSRRARARRRAAGRRRRDARRRRAGGAASAVPSSRSVSCHSNPAR